MLVTLCDDVGRRTTVSLYRVYLCVTLLVTQCYPVGYALCDYAGKFHTTHGISLCDLVGYSILPSWLCFV